MSKKIRRFLSSILVLTMVFTSVCTNCVFAETAENNSAFAEFISREPVATGTAVTYNLQETADCSIDISGEGASREVGGTWVDATNGKFYNIGRPNNGAQVNTGTIIYVPVNSTSDIVINTGYNTGTVKISDVYDYEGDFEYLD